MGTYSSSSENGIRVTTLYEYNVEARIDALLTKDTAKLDVYINEYDSHAYNALHYWRDKFPYPFISDDTRAFKVGDVYLTEHDMVTYQGKPMTVGEYYDSIKRLP